MLIKDLIVFQYQDLAREVWKMWDVKAKVIPVVMGALGSVPMVIDVEISVKLIQKCAMLGPAKTF